MGVVASVTDTLFFTFDNADRLTNLTADLASTAQDLSISYSYNAAGQIATQTRSPDAYAWTGHYNIDRLYSVNGLNQILTSGQLGLNYDARGNLTSSGSSNFTYTLDNQLQTAPNVLTGGTAGLVYDSLGRLFKVGGTSATIFQYDGINLVGEYGAGATLRRYVHGPGTDEPIVQYEGANTANRRFLMRDERGSIVAVSDSAGGILATNSYDEYGIPSSTNQGRFQYTGQAWLPEIGMYYYKARIYSPRLGRFLQTDPIGYADGMNWYAYVGNDPVNFRDPTGMLCRNGQGRLVTDPSISNGDLITTQSHCEYAQQSSRGALLAIFEAAGWGNADWDRGLWVPSTQAPMPQRGPCPNSGGILGWLPHGVGITGGVAESVGLPKVAGAAVQGSLGIGGFVDDNVNATFAVFNSAGAAAYAGGSSVGLPSQNSPGILGGSISGGFSGFLTNAQSERQLSGPFTTRTLDVGLGPYQASMSLSTAGGIWQLSFSPPGAGLTLGASYSKITTTTTDSGIGCY